MGTYPQAANVHERVTDLSRKKYYEIKGKRERYVITLRIPSIFPSEKDIFVVLGVLMPFRKQKMYGKNKNDTRNSTILRSK